MKNRHFWAPVLLVVAFALALGGCKKKPKEEKTSAGDMAAASMKPDMAASMKPDMAVSMKPDMAASMKPDMVASMKPDMAAAMKPDMAAKGPAVAKDGAYVIKFDRPLKVGLKYKMVTTGGQKGKTTVNGKVVPKQTQSRTFTYEATHTVKAVHATGKATKEEIEILKFKVTEAGQTRDVLAAGTKVLAEVKNAKEVFTVGGKEVKGMPAKLLQQIVSLYEDGNVETDKVFGPDGPRKVGDSWNVNVAQLLAGLKQKFKKAALWPKPSDVTGKVKLVGVKKLSGMDSLEIQIHATLKNIAPVMGPVKATAGTMEIGMSGLLPKDTKTPLAGVLNMSLKMHIEGEMTKGGKSFKLVVDIHQFSKQTKTLLK